MGGEQGEKEALEIAEEAREKYVKPSFASQLFMGCFNAQLLEPFPESPIDEQKIGDEYLHTLTEYLTQNLDPDEVDRTREIPQKVIDGLVKMGAFALKIPKEYGGLGFSQTTYNRIIQAVASYCASTAVLLSAHQSIGVPQPLLMFGTREQCQKFLPRFRSGSISAFALTEPHVGSDPAQMTSEAKLSDEGQHYILNGVKLWCTNGTIADIIVVVAKTAPKIIRGKEKKQISAFILEMNTPGVEVVQRCEFMGLSGIYNGVLKFVDVKIPKENLIGEEGRGLAIALSTINVGRLTLPAACAAAAKQCLHVARTWGKERVQWGSPIGRHEEGEAKIGYMAATTLAMEAMTWLTSAWQDGGEIDIRIEAAMAKLFCSEELWSIADKTLQLRGGRGYEKAPSLKERGEKGYPVERLLRDCRINRILEGSTEIMKLFLAREALDPHLKKILPLLNPKTPFYKKAYVALKALLFYALWLPKQYLAYPFTKKYPFLGTLAPHYRYCQKTSHRLAWSLMLNMFRFGPQLEKKQLLLGHLMEIGTDLFALSATCAYARHLVNKRPEDETPLLVADYFGHLVQKRIENNFRDLATLNSAPAARLTTLAFEGGLDWLEEGIIKEGIIKEGIIKEGIINQEV